MNDNANNDSISNSEVEELLAAITTGSLTNDQRQRVEHLVQNDTEFRKAYLECIEMDALLRFRHQNIGHALQDTLTPDTADTATTPRRNSSTVEESTTGELSAAKRIVIGAGAVAAMAASIVLAMFLLPRNQTNTKPIHQSIQNLAADQESFEFNGWQVSPGIDTKFDRVGDSKIRLVSGELFATSLERSTSTDLIVETKGGNVKAHSARFYVSSESHESQSAKNRSDDAQQSTAEDIAMPSATRLLVLAGSAVLSNTAGELIAKPGSFISASPGETPVQMQEEGNYREAFDVYKKLIVNTEHSGNDCQTDIDRAWECLQKLGRIDEWDELIERVIDTHRDDWEVLYAAALRYWYAPHRGVIIDNQFLRAGHGGRSIDVTERDRIRALQLMKQAMPLLPAGENQVVGNFYFNLSEMIRGHRQLWNLQTLTNIDRMPDYGEPVYWSHNSAPPVDENDNPIYYQMPQSWDSAENDGERWRWLLLARAKADPSKEMEEKFRFADFLHSQFGVQTSGSISLPFLTDGKLADEGRYTTHTLASNETIARLATGIRRFQMPAGQSFIALYQEIANTPLDEEPESPINDLTYKVYSGKWRELPRFDDLDPVSSGNIANGLLDLDVAQQTESYGISFEGKFSVPTDGECIFGLQSDDGTKLWINDQLVIDFDGCHGMDHREGRIKLDAGTYTFRLDYFEHSGDEGLILTWNMPGKKQQFLSRQRHSMSPQERAMEKLAYIHENRRQFSKAVSWWQKCNDQFGFGRNKWRRAHLKQILGNWVRFESVANLPAGKKASLPMTYRNATSARFKARKVDIEQVIADSKAYLKSDPRRLEYKYGILDIGKRIVAGKETKYLADESIEWTRKLDPPANHWNRQTEIETPLDEAGVYLVEATANDGNTSRVLCWITDTTIVMKKTNNRHLYFIADSMTGEPVAKANVEIFAFWKQHRKETARDYTQTRNFSRFTDEQGLIYTDADDVDDRKFSRIVIARDEESGRFGFLGDFFREPLQPLTSNPYQLAKAWCATDRPVYRPGQHVHHKSWIRLAQYDLDHVSLYGGKEFTVAVFAPGNKEVLKKKIRTDEWGGLAFDWKLENDAMLGSYHFDVIANNFTQPAGGKTHQEIVLGTGHFRVEEYKKPEYEVKVDAPSEPVALGEKFAATISANYYFGAPVANATVKYTVTRTSTVNSWFPRHPWDWFYGTGHWWWGYDYSWYPGWSRWCLRPVGWFHPSPPEVVLENTVPINKDGKLKIEVDSAIAKELFGDTDHRYQITAEVVDESRRTVTGNGTVIAARSPFDVFVWMDGGHYRIGNQMEATIQARTANGKGVSGEGEAILYRIVFDQAGKPRETKVESWPIETDADGRAKLTIKADRPGQYRVACEIADGKGRKREGAALTRITGTEDEIADDGFRFDDLELVLDKSKYQPGETARLLINTEQANSTVALFVRCVNGVYPKPRIIKIDGKSSVQEIVIQAGDMPNVHVEAFTVSKGQLYQVTRNITVPPEERVLTLDVEPSDEDFQPGEKAKVKLRLKDSDGKPFVGSTVVAIYDKSLEAIAASQITDIRSHFWKWSRGHSIRSRFNSYRFGQLLKHDEIGMNDFGTHWLNYWRGRSRMYFGEDFRHSNRSLSMFSQTKDLWFEPMEGATLGVYFNYDTAGADLMRLGGLDKGIDFGRTTKGKGVHEEPAPTVRSRFADTALWLANVTTDQNGFAEVELEMPENLTTWKIKAWSMGHGTRVGHGEAEVITSKDVMIRLQSPRFFTESDEVVLSANVHNYTGQRREFKVAIEIPGDELELIDTSDSTRTVSVDPDEDQRVDWRVRAAAEGDALIRISATTTDGKGDAMEQSYPVFVHGFLKTESYSLAIRGAEQGKSITVSVPERRRAEQSRLEVRYSPSIALSLVDALPYLAANPYKNSESAVSRFGPLVTLKKILTDMDVDLEEVRNKQINLNPQEIGDAQQRAAQWRRERDTNPIFNEVALNKLVERSLADLNTLQNQDGGWGWYSGHDSAPHTTAYVIHGLQTAKANGVAVVPNVIKRGLDWLQRYQDRELKKLKNADGKYRPWKANASNIDAFVFMVLIDADRISNEMADFLYRDRLKLSHYCQAMVGLAMDKLGLDEKRDMIIRNLSQFQQRDPENQTSWLQLNRRAWWNWYGDDIETNAYYLKLLCRTGKAKEETAAGLAKYLLNNRKHATYWNSSRDTCVAIEALAEYARASGETEPNMTVTVLVNDELKKEVTINKDNLFSFDNVWLIEGTDVVAGDSKIEIRRTGTGPLYANAYLTNFTMEDFITESGLEIKVQRRYYKLQEKKLEINAAGSRGNVVDYQVNQWTRTPLVNGATIESGDLIEVELVLESKNDYEYLQFSDRKAAGFEVMEVKSGHRWLGGISAYMELRDEKVDFFIQRLSQGTHSLTYRLRAEIPGKFSALPANCNGVYAPELRANSDEAKLNIE